jgi:hypothetical protein
MNYQQAYEELAAQVRRLGIAADVQISEVAIEFGDKFDEHQTLLAVQSTVATLNRVVVQMSNLPPIVEHDPYECRKCGGDCVTDAASGMRVCVICGEGN